MGEAVPQIEVGARPDLVEIRLLGLPLSLHRAVTEHMDELRREFRLLQVQQADDEMHDVPRRLLRFIAEVEQRFADFADSTNDDLDDAFERGAEAIDLVFRLPPAAKEAALELEDLLDEADEFCRTGETLLTLQSTPEARAYRSWYLGEIARQADGASPTPWLRR